MLLVYLDPYLLGDPLFLTQLARDIAHRDGGAILIHGSGEAGERAIEATGAVARQRGGVWEAESPELLAEVERAARELNRQIVHELNEAGVSAIRVIGADRGLVKGVDGDVEIGRTDWLEGLVSQGVVGVVAAFVAGEGDPLSEVDAVRVAARLAKAMGGEPVAAIASGSGADRVAHDARIIEQFAELGVEAIRLPRAEIRRSVSA